MKDFPYFPLILPFIVGVITIVVQLKDINNSINQNESARFKPEFVPPCLEINAVQDMKK